jgi:uncharacterized protein YvpB
MKSRNNLSPSQENKLNKVLLRIGYFITSPPILVILPAFLIGAVVVYTLLFHQSGSSQASEAARPMYTTSASKSVTTPSPAVSASPTDLPTPTPTHTPTSQPTRTPRSTPTAKPTSTLPASAQVEGLRGKKQSMPLSCEARSAVDWAAYFDFEIEENNFFDGLPSSDNPDLGFVGDVYGSWGQIPPDDYGVHAGPIAQRLREYGLNAKHLRHMTMEELKRQIADGKPVIIWVVGHVNRGTPVPYTSTGGEITTVAKFEHTVIVTGYTEHKVTVLDGARVYSIYQGEFLKSWGVLENQAVIWIE